MWKKSRLEKQEFPKLGDWKVIYGCKKLYYWIRREMFKNPRKKMHQLINRIAINVLKM